MRKFLFTIFFSFLVLNLFAQEKKIKIAIVSDLDTTLSVVSSSKEKKFDISLNLEWVENFKDYLDANEYQVEYVELPLHLRNLKSYTNGFSKMNSKFTAWLNELNSNEGFNTVIFLGKAILHPSTAFSSLNRFSTYGVNIKRNYVFSKNRLIIVNPTDSKIIGEVLLRSYDDYIGYSKNSDKKTIETIEESDLGEAKKNIIILNKRIAQKASEKIKKEKMF